MERNQQLNCRPNHPHRCCCISVNSVALQLVHGVYKTKNRESASLMMQEVSELWRIVTLPDKCISRDISPLEFTNAFQLRKSENAPGFDSICPELILGADAALKCWLNKFLSFCMYQIKLSHIWGRALVVAIRKPNKPTANTKAINQSLCYVSSIRP